MFEYKILMKDDLEDENLVEGLHRLSCQYWEEINELGDPPSIEETKRKLFRYDPSWRWIRWIVRQDDAVVGQGSICLLKPGIKANEQLKNDATIRIFISREHRRKGIAKRLLWNMLSRTKNEGITTIESLCRTDSGRVFCESLKGKMDGESVVLRLPIKDFSDAKLSEIRLKYKNQTTSLNVQITNNLTNKDMEQYINLDVMVARENWISSYGDNKPFDEAFARRDFIEYEKQQEKEGVNKIIATLRNGHGKLVGYTRICYDKRKPDSAELESGCILPEFRGKGLGTLMNVSLVEWVKNNIDDVSVIMASTNLKNSSARSALTKIGFVEMATTRYYVWKCSDLLSELGMKIHKHELRLDKM